MKHILKLSLLISLTFTWVACDQVDDEIVRIDQISTESERYHFDREDVVIPIYGSFEQSTLDIITTNNQLRPIQTDRSITDVTFMRYLPGGTDSESIEIQVVDGTRVIGQGTVEVRRVNRSANISSGVSKAYTVELGENKFSIDFLSELGHGLQSPKMVEARVIPVRRAVGSFAYGASVITKLNEEGTMDVELNYETWCNGDDFGTQEFVVEVCLEPTTSAGNVWIDPIKNCGTYTTALTSFSYGK